MVDRKLTATEAAQLSGDEARLNALFPDRIAHDDNLQDGFRRLAQAILIRVPQSDAVVDQLASVYVLTLRHLSGAVQFDRNSETVSDWPHFLVDPGPGFGRLKVTTSRVQMDALPAQLRNAAERILATVRIGQLPSDGERGDFMRAFVAHVERLDTAAEKTAFVKLFAV